MMALPGGVDDNNSTDARVSALRIDSGVAEGHVVTPHYDPMLSKVVAYDSESRLGAIDRLASAMEEYVVGPSIQHNGRLVLDVLRHEA